MWKTVGVNITYPSADCRKTWPKINITSMRKFADFTFHILKCREGPSFIHLVMSAMFIWTYSYVSFSSNSFFLLDLLAWHCEAWIYWAVNFNLLWELLRKLSPYRFPFSQHLQFGERKQIIRLIRGMLREICERLSQVVGECSCSRKWQQSNRTTRKTIERQNKRTHWCFRSTTLCLFKHQ